MRRRYLADAAANPPVPPAVGSEGYPSNGDPGGGVEPTTVGAFAFYMLVEARALVIEAANLVLDDDPAQFLAALNALYLTQAEGDARYLRQVPAEFLTQAEGDARYLRQVPAEFLTQAEGDARYRRIASYSEIGAARYTTRATLYGALDTALSWMPNNRSVQAVGGVRVEDTGLNLRAEISAPLITKLSSGAYRLFGAEHGSTVSRMGYVTIPSGGTEVTIAVGDLSSITTDPTEATVDMSLNTSTAHAWLLVPGS